MKKGKLIDKIIGIALVLIVLGVLFSFGTPVLKNGASAQVPRNWYVDDNLVDHPAADFTKIQEAVDAASSGDTIIVYPGTYAENVDVYKDHLTIQSENGAEATIVWAADPNDHVFEVTADYVNITRFTVKGATGFSSGSGVSGIYLKGTVSDTVSDMVEHCQISENIILYNRTGIGLYIASNNILTNNIVNSNSYYGIWLFYFCAHNILTNNIVKSNDLNGIVLCGAAQTFLAGNAMSDNKNNLWVGGFAASTPDPWVSDYAHHIDTSNTVDGRPIYYLIGEHNRIIDSSTDAGYVGLVNCSNITVKDLALSHNNPGLLLIHCRACRIENVNISNCDLYGISLLVSSANTLTSNTASYNYIGIDSFGSSNNTLVSNTLSCNYQHGMSILDSDNNIIYLSDFIDNSNSVDYCASSGNIWHSLRQKTYTYNGNTFTDYLGNYWDDYTGSDADGDGIGDTPYLIDSDADNYPLMEPLENYQIGLTVTWNCPLGGQAFIAPNPDAGRPSLSVPVACGDITVSEGAELWGIYYLIETGPQAGTWLWYIPDFTTNTLTQLEPDKLYWVVVSAPCTLTIPEG